MNSFDPEVTRETVVHPPDSGPDQTAPGDVSGVKIRDESVNCLICGLALLREGIPCPRCGGDPDRTWVEPAGVQELAAAALTPTPGLTLNPDERYEVLGTLGRGGMGIVYKVRDRELDEVVALKVLKSEFSRLERTVDRFKKELKLARRVNHPNVARMFDLFSWHGSLAISQEYIEGNDLAQILTCGPMGYKAVVGHLRYICSALQLAHDLGVVHRDLKPGNVRIDLRGRPRVLDFGLAALADEVSSERNEGHVLGTPFYMAPEQAFAPETVDHRADVYSLGVMLFQMITGQLPFPMTSPQEVLFAHKSQAPPRPTSVYPEVPRLLENVILKCLEKDPAKRFAKVRDVWTEARPLLGETPTPVGTPVPRERGGRAPGKVLVVDSQEKARAGLRKLLASRRLVSEEASDGYKGIEAALRERPALIVLDMDCPVLDGTEALRILKSNPQTSSIPVIMVSAEVDEEKAMLNKDMGAVAVLRKPVEDEVFGLLLEKYVG